MKDQLRNQTIIEGTQDPRDLIPAFLHALNEVAPVTLSRFLETVPLPIEAQEDNDNPWWDSESATRLVADLIDLLDENAPRGCRFGVHESNVSDYGFWPFPGEGA